MHNKHEPPPLYNENGKTCWGNVIEKRLHDEKDAALILDMLERDSIGREKYGTNLRPFNGRNVMVDLYQELLDVIVYSEQAIMEFEATGENFKATMISVSQSAAITFARWVKGVLDGTEG